MRGPFYLQVFQLRRHALGKRLTQRAHGATCLPRFHRTDARPKSWTRCRDPSIHRAHHGEPAVLMAQGQTTARAMGVRSEPAFRLLRHQHRLDLGNEGSTFRKAEAQLGKIFVASINDRDHRAAFTLGITVARIDTGLNDQSLSVLRFSQGVPHSCTHSTGVHPARTPFPRASSDQASGRDTLYAGGCRWCREGAASFQQHQKASLLRLRLLPPCVLDTTPPKVSGRR